MDGLSELELLAEVELHEKRLQAARERLAHSNCGVPKKEHEQLRKVEAELEQAIDRLHHFRRSHAA